MTRATYTNLDVLQEKTYQRLGSKFVGLMDRIHQVHFVERKSYTGKMWPGGGLTKMQATARPDYLWPEIWIGSWKAAEKQEKQDWAMEKPKARERSKTERHRS